MTSAIRLLRDIIREELGRNMRSPPAEDIMRDWRHLPGIHATITVDPVGGSWQVMINDEVSKEKLPTMSFKQESEAIHYARKTAFDIYNRRIQGGSGKKREPSWS
jgi:hypothetical protein